MFLISCTAVCLRATYHAIGGPSIRVATAYFCFFFFGEYNISKLLMFLLDIEMYENTLEQQFDETTIKRCKY